MKYTLGNKDCFCLLNEWGLHDRMNCTCYRHCKRKDPVPEEEIQKELEIK